MSNEARSLYQLVRETAEGQCAAVVALVIALDEVGVLPKEKYTDALNRMWLDMPEETALGETGGAIERMLELLENAGHSSAGAARPRQGKPGLDAVTVAPPHEAAA